MRLLLVLPLLLRGRARLNPEPGPLLVLLTDYAYANRLLYGCALNLMYQGQPKLSTLINGKDVAHPHCDCLFLVLTLYLLLPEISLSVSVTVIVRVAVEVSLCVSVYQIQVQPPTGATRW